MEDKDRKSRTNFVCSKSPLRLKVRTLPFQGKDTGSNPVEDKICNL